MFCESCDCLIINGNICHERGCPDAWRDETRECKWCGTTFTPEYPLQCTCSHSCDMAWAGLDCDCDECHVEMDEK